MEASISKKRFRFGLWGKLILAILAAGTIPILVGLSIAYFKGSSQLREVIGGSFQALAKESATKIDAEIQRVIDGDGLRAVEAAKDPAVRKALFAAQPGEGGEREERRRLDWPGTNETDDPDWTILASWVTEPDGGPVGTRGENPIDSSGSPRTRVSGLHLSGDEQHYLFQIAVPIQDGDNRTLIGWLHRNYDVKRLLDPLVYPIRFGTTGHVMIIDNIGSIVSCPLLVTGSRIRDKALIARVAGDRGGWIAAENDGHGKNVFSIVGHAPLTGLNRYLLPGVSWHTFVWQDSREIFAPARSLLMGIALAGLLAIGLLGILGYYASRKIVHPIRRLREEAARIAAGDLEHTLDIRTGDEIQELAGEFNGMQVRLRQFIGSLEEKVEDRTKELKDTQAEKDRIVEQLIQTEKVAAIGTMASGIGHEINNPLYGILGLAEAIRDEKEASRCNEYGREIIKYSKHIAEIVRNLSGYIRPAEKHNLEQVDVNEKLYEAVSMAKRSLLSNHVVIKENLTPVPVISAKSEEIQQTFFNIIRNGIQAMKGRGTLEIDSCQKDKRVWVRIRDTGSGIATEHLGKIFDPFFTTKGPDEGEGLGMYIVQQIVKKYGGTITLESKEGVGTAVTIEFPIGETN